MALTYKLKIKGAAKVAVLDLAKRQQCDLDVLIRRALALLDYATTEVEQRQAVLKLHWPDGAERQILPGKLSSDDGDIVKIGFVDG